MARPGRPKTRDRLPSHVETKKNIDKGNHHSKSLPPIETAPIAAAADLETKLTGVEHTCERTPGTSVVHVSRDFDVLQR